MIRPHGGGFVYSELEIEAMIEDAVLVRRTGADGIVVGVLRPASYLSQRIRHAKHGWYARRTS